MQGLALGVYGIGTIGTAAAPGRAFVQGARLGPTLTQLERKLAGVAIQGTVARMGEVSLLAFDPARESADLVDLSVATDVKLLRMASRSWRPW